MGASAGAGPALASAVPVRRNMTDNVPQGGNGSGEGETAAPQPWFPPSGEPGGYGQPPPFDPGRPPGSPASRRAVSRADSGSRDTGRRAGRGSGATPPGRASPRHRNPASSR